MNARTYRIALALAAALIGASSLVRGSDVAQAPSGDEQSLRAATTEPAEGPSRADGRARSNSPHPAVLSYEHPVYPIGVPNPPVSLERY